MPTDEERREVARRLRGLPGNSTYPDLIGAIADRDGWYPAADAADRLADLIEPGEPEVRCVAEVKVDVERLLAIATMMAADSVRSVKQGISISPVYILHAARNIAEACGETFGSIRNRELAKWGTSIVPKETIVDRDALLALADEMDAKSNDSTVNPDPMKPTASSLDLFGYARRIREALGVVG